MTKTIEETAQKIQDYFFERGATIKKQDWCWLIGILQKDRADLVERVEKFALTNADSGYVDRAIQRIIQLLKE